MHHHLSEKKKTEKGNKLISNLNDKEKYVKYVAHTVSLEQCLDHGLKLKKSRVIKFKSNGSIKMFI